MSADNFYTVSSLDGKWLVASGSMSELIELESDGPKWDPLLHGYRHRWFDDEQAAWDYVDSEWSEYGVIAVPEG